MIFYYLDASAWVKRYHQEPGTAWIQALFSQPLRLVCSSVGLIEVVATLARKRKGGEVGELFHALSGQKELRWVSMPGAHFPERIYEETKDWLWQVLK